MEPARTLERPRASPAASAPSAAVLAALLVAFLAIAFWVYAPVLPGGFVSDDRPYVLYNPYVQELSRENVLAILDPFGEPVSYAMNWAPVSLLLHALQVRAFGPDVRGYHALNVGLHAVAAVLLVALLSSSRLPVAAAVLGGLVFLVHPANVEAVAFIFQLKTVLATALALGAVLAHRRLPALAVALFCLGLLAKISAVFALPVAVVRTWARAPGCPPRWGWLCLWLLAFVGVAIPELTAFQRVGENPVALHEDPWVQVRSMVAIFARYLAIAATSWGVSAFHQPEPAVSWWNPWWLGGVAAFALLAWRSVVTLRRRDEEAAYWALAAASFAPVSQVFSFMYPMADRYLYGILPGLIGGSLLVGREAWRAWWAAGGRSGRRRVPAGASAAAGLAVLVGLALALGFAQRSHRRAWVYRSDAGLRRDAARHYPNGMQAHLLRAEEAGASGDGETAARALEAMADDGFIGFLDLQTDPALAPVLGHPGVVAVIRRMAGEWIENGKRLEAPGQTDLVMIAEAHRVRGETADAVRTLERALAVGGPLEGVIHAYLAELRRPEAARPLPH